MKDINEDMQDQIKEICDTHISEAISGRLVCSNYGLKKIAAIIGCDYKLMSKQGKKQFRMDVIAGYQMRFFKQYGIY